MKTTIKPKPFSNLSSVCVYACIYIPMANEQSHHPNFHYPNFELTVGRDTRDPRVTRYVRVRELAPDDVEGFGCAFGSWVCVWCVCVCVWECVCVSLRKWASVGMVAPERWHTPQPKSPVTSRATNLRRQHINEVTKPTLETTNRSLVWNRLLPLLGRTDPIGADPRSEACATDLYKWFQRKKKMKATAPHLPVQEETSPLTDRHHAGPTAFRDVWTPV